jgi:enoyl-CoA hydratase/carnithine racemase
VAVVEYTVAEGVATLILNRPDKMNALNLEMWGEVSGHLGRIADAPDLRCLVVRGAGGNFAAGADLAEFRAARWTTAQAASYGEAMLRALHGLRDCRYPTVAAIEGNCIGGGLEIAAMCDLRLASRDARFGIPIQKIGVTMPYPELSDLVALLGRATMLELLLEGGVHDAQWAYEKGLVTRLSDPVQFEQDLTGVCRKIISGSPLSHRNHKAMTLRCLSADPLTAEETRGAYAACEAADYREGVEAFLSKRRPLFGGN